MPEINLQFKEDSVLLMGGGRKKTHATSGRGGGGKGVENDEKYKNENMVNHFHR